MKSYFFVGIKGSGMSALAQILFDMGHRVKGSDIEKYFFTQEGLEKSGIKILPFDKKNMKKNMTVIAGNAFPDSHEEIVQAREIGAPVIRYHHFLGDFLKQYTSIAITGVHGKTSTTGLMAHVFRGARPTSFLIGDGTGKGEVNSKYFIFESCEYRRHFLSYNPDYCIMTNIDFDHPDYYKSMEDVYNAFQEMANQVNKAIVACGDDYQLRKIRAKVPVVFYGFSEDNEFQAQKISINTDGTTFDVYVKGQLYGTYKIPTFGDHNVLNALAVIATSFYEKLDDDIVKKQLMSFSGVKRRFTEKEFSEQVLVDDYAHHPTEISATLDSARKKYAKKELVAIFQPHTFTRTKAFLKEFASALSKADHVYLCDIFGSAREKAGDLSIIDLQKKIENAEILQLENTAVLQKHKQAVLIFMGAGDVQKYQDAYEKVALS